MGVPFFLSRLTRVLQYAGILNLEDGGPLPAVCVQALHHLLDVNLVYPFTFNFISFFCEPVIQVEVWTRS